MARIGGYEIKSELGRGGMGVVYLAHDPRAGRDVALKLIESDDPELLARFEIEGQALAAIDHPNVVRVHATGIDQGRAYLVMEVVEGASLQDRLREGPLGIDEAARLVAELARAMECVHRPGALAPRPQAGKRAPASR